MEYTKGNWKSRKSVVGDWVIETDDELICREVRHYNAHLISAAPDMYETLIDAQNYIARAEMKKDPINRTPLEERLIKVRAKAEGK